MLRWAAARGPSLLAIACGLALVAPGFRAARAQGPIGATLVSHDFTSRPKAGASAGTRARASPSSAPSGGHPGGCITGVDEALGETWYFHAPATVVQQLPAAVNGTISFSLKQSGTIISLIDDDVVIVGRRDASATGSPMPPGTDWTDFSVRAVRKRGVDVELEPACHPGADRAASWRRRLRLEIRGEYVTGRRTRARWTISC